VRLLTAFARVLEERVFVERVFVERPFVVEAPFVEPVFVVARFVPVLRAIADFGRVPDALVLELRRCVEGRSALESSFFAAPTAAGIATPNAAPATTFFDVDIPSSLVSMRFTSFTSRR